jgi:hypothetical protein
MNKLLAVLKGEPALLAGVGTAVGPVLGLFGVPKATVIVLGALAAAVWAIVVRMLVMPVGKVAGAVQDAALGAASTAVAGLGPVTVGEVGELTDVAKSTIASAVNTATTGVLAGINIAPPDAVDAG